MPDSNPRDLLTPQIALAIAAPAIIAVIIGRHYAQTVAPIAGLLATFGAMWTVDRLEGKRRMLVGTLAAIAGWYTVAVLWPWSGPGPSFPASLVALAAGLAAGLALAKVGLLVAGEGRVGVVGAAMGLLVGLSVSVPIARALGDRTYTVGVLTLVPIGLAGFAVWCIGSGHNKRVIPKASQALKTIVEQNLPAGVALLDKEPVMRGGKLTQLLKAGANTPRGAMAEFDRKIASTATTKRGTVKLVDLGPTMGEGIYRIEVGKPGGFTCPPPARPEFNPDAIPLGWDEHGNVVSITNRLHGMVAGETGSGKSNTLNVILETAWRRGDRLILIDPKETELFPWACHAKIYADSPAEMIEALKEVSRIARKRRLDLRAKGRKNWTKEDGQHYTVIIDEMSELCTLCPEAKALTSSLARLARSAGIQIWFADQYPTADTFPKGVKQNTPNIIGHRVKNGTAVRVLLDEDATKEGWNLADTTLPAGRAVVAVQGKPRQWVQVFPEEGVPPVPVTPSHRPINPPPYAGETACDPPVTCDPVTPECDPPLGKHDGPVLDALGSTPKTQSAIAKELRIHATLVGRSLGKLASLGLAAEQDGGWVDPRMAHLGTDNGVTD